MGMPPRASCLSAWASAGATCAGGSSASTNSLWQPSRRPAQGSPGNCQAPAAGAKEYKARHILVEKEDEAKAIIAQLKKGGKFEDIAKKQSKDPGSGAQSGDLGWANPSGYVPEFADALKKLNKGQLSDAPVKSQFGYHIIRVDDVRDAKAPELPSFEQVKPQVVQQLQQQQLVKFQEDLRAKAKVE